MCQSLSAVSRRVFDFTRLTLLLLDVLEPHFPLCGDELPHKGFPGQKYHHLSTLVDGLSPVIYATLNEKVTRLCYDMQNVPFLFPPTEPLVHQSLTFNPLGRPGCHLCSFSWHISHLKIESVNKQYRDWFPGRVTVDRRHRWRESSGVYLCQVIYLCYVIY